MKEVPREEGRGAEASAPLPSPQKPIVFNSYTSNVD